MMAGTTVPGTVEFVFNLEYNRLVNGQVDVFSIDASWKSIIGQQGIKVIAKKLEYLIPPFTLSLSNLTLSRNALFAYVRTFNKDDRIFMEVTELKTDPGSEEYLIGDKPIDWVKTPRPPNAFILYRQHHHESMKAKYPEYRNTDLCKCSSFPLTQCSSRSAQIIGAKWKSETLSVQKYYREMARGIKEEHSKLFPEYSYRHRL